MAQRQKPSATNRLSISVTELQWDLIRERAAARGLTMSRYLVRCGAPVAHAPAAVVPSAFVLREAE